MSADILVRPSDPDFVGERALADLEALRARLEARFPEAAHGVVGALADRPILTDGELVVRPELPTRPLVLHEVLRLAAPLQLTVRAEELGVDADPRHRIDVDVHVTPSLAHATAAEHEVLGRLHGVLPWVTRPMLDALVGGLAREGDRLLFEAAAGRALGVERSGTALELSIADGPDRPLRGARVTGGGEIEVAARVAWHWVTCDHSWERELAWTEVGRLEDRLVG